MKTQSEPHAVERLGGPLRALVEHTARSLGVSLEIWTGPGQASDRLGLAPACAACADLHPQTFDRCRKRRSYLSRRDAPVAPRLAERCAQHVRLARLAAKKGEPGPVLFAFGYRDDGGAENGDERILSFLADLHALLPTAPSQPANPDDPNPTHDAVVLLHSVAGMLAEPASLQATSPRILAGWRHVLDADCTCVWLHDRNLLELASRDPAAAQDREVWGALVRRACQTLARTSKEYWLEQLPAQHPLAVAAGGPCTCIAVPLLVERSLRGVLCTLRRSTGDAEAELVLLQSFAGQLSLALANGELLERQRGFLASTVKALVAAIDAKDSYTAGHSERVNIIAMLLGHELALELDELEALYWGALLHDVGKIALPETLLNKPTKLADEELDLVKEHPERGWQLLQSIEPLHRAAQGVRHHHEYWDGTGYPLGLAGKDIPPIARVIAVADAFDAIISHRAYRKGRPARVALDVIASCSGTQFDPEVVAALGRLLPLLEKHQWVLMGVPKASLPAQPVPEA